jgi:single-strand DNA-binding protein
MQTTNLLILRGYTCGAPKGFSNGRIAKVSVATNRSWIDKTTGDRVEKTDWVDGHDSQRAGRKIRSRERSKRLSYLCRVPRGGIVNGRTIYGVDIVAEVFDLLAPPAAQTEERVNQTRPTRPARRARRRARQSQPITLDSRSARRRRRCGEGARPSASSDR